MNLSLEFQYRLRRVGVCLYDDSFVLKSFVAFAVVSKAYAAFIAWFYRLFREFDVGAAALIISGALPVFLNL